MPVHSQHTTQRRQRFSQTLVPETAVDSVSANRSSGYQSDVELLEVTSRDIRCFIDANPMIGDTVSFDVQHDEGPVSHVSGLVHWKQIRRSGYEVGLYLANSLPASLTGLMTDQRRKSNRYRCRQTGRLYRPDSGQRSDAVVVNYSYDGISIQANSFCDVDESVVFEWASEQSCQEVSCQVLWHIEQQNGVLLGCQTAPGAGYRIAGLRV